jgi:hypothetical protein
VQGDVGEWGEELKSGVERLGCSELCGCEHWVRGLNILFIHKESGKGT